MLISLQNYLQFLGTPIGADQNYTTLIQTIAEGVEFAAAQYCGRLDHLQSDDTQVITFAYTEGLEHHVLKQKEIQSVSLPIWPVASINAISGSGGVTAELLLGSPTGSTEDFTSQQGWELHGHDGSVEFSYWLQALLSLYEKVTIEYNGGYIGDLPSGSFAPPGATILPQDLRLALLMTVKWIYAHKGDVGVVSYSVPGGVILSQEQFPPQSRAIFDRYKNDVW